MIGNLFNAVCIALLSGTFALGGAKAETIVNMGNSWVSGEEVEVIASSSVTYTSAIGGNADAVLYGFDNSVLDGAELPSTAIYNAQFSSMLLADNYSWNDFNITQDYYLICKQHFTSPVTIDGHEFFYALRVGVSSLTNINGFEFKANADACVFRYGVQFDGLYFNYLFQGKQPQLNAIGIYDMSASQSLNGGSLVNGSLDDYAPYKMVEFLVLFGLPQNTSVQQPNKFTCEFQFINGSSDVNYITGYNNGYTIGSTEGYNKGYSDGLAVSHNSSFMGLFSSIADTPLRFIYGIFNFDLFGISCLVIVLSLLTGIIVFGIVKKFWK